MIISVIDVLLQRNYEFEVEAYKQQLEDVYKLCWSCERKVNKILHKQNATLCNKLRDSPPSRHIINEELNLSNLSNTSACSVGIIFFSDILWNINSSRAFTNHFI